MNTSIIVTMEADEVKELVDYSIRSKFQYGHIKFYDHKLTEFTILNNGKLMATYDEKPEEPAKKEEPTTSELMETL